jgi:hypothetical protein
VWMLLALWAVATAVSAALYVAQAELTDALSAAAPAVFAVAGALLAARRPGNPIGWLLLAVALLLAGSAVARALYIDAVSGPQPDLFARSLVWFETLAFNVWLWLSGIMIPLLFPDGRLQSRRWRGFALLSAAAVAVAALGQAFGSATLEFDNERFVANPFRISGPVGDTLETLGAAGGPLFTLVFLGALGGLALRLRRSAGVERQQMKWLASAIGLLLAGLVAAGGGTLAGFDAIAFAGWWLFLLALVFGLPLAIGVAVLRYRLYDIDVVINRALVYGALTLTLAATYLGGVLLVGLAVGESDLAVAASTLAVAALFRPARARIQAAVDRRFYRRRYDAGKTLAAFGARLRDELDLEALGADLRGVVRETVAPTHVSLWLRGTP